MHELAISLLKIELQLYLDLAKNAKTEHNRSVYSNAAEQLEYSIECLEDHN